MSLTRQDSVRILEKMLRIRRFEETVVELLHAGAYVGHCHVYIGQEATGAALVDLLEKEDLIVDTHRNHGHLIARGVDLKKAMAEIVGRQTGLLGGRGGSAHLSDKSIGFLWSTAVVGGSIGLGIGAAFAIKQQRKKAVAVAFFGDGALEEGIAFESFNIAAIEKLPILFVCENNSGGAVGISAGEWPSSTLHARYLVDMPKALNIRAEVVDGTDVAAVRQVTTGAIAAIRQGQGPIFIEARTERWPGSRFARTQLATGIFDVTAVWRPELLSGEYADWTQRHDPLHRFIGEAIAWGHVDMEKVVAMDAEVRAEVDEARQFALNSPAPTVESAHLGTFA